MMVQILITVFALGGMGFLFGMGLGFAEKKFKTEDDPRIGYVIDALPSANCGACGLPGCNSFAAAVIKGEADPAGCPIGGNDTAMAIGEIMGVKVKEVEKKTAFIRCGGGKSNSSYRYEYHGMKDCNAAILLAAGGSKSCSYGCLGGKNCYISCEFGAVIMEDGIARIDSGKCTACGKCVPVCPKNLIVMIPLKGKVRVACNTRDDARTVRANCKVGCINCKQCYKACNHDAVNMYDYIAEIEYEKCNNCGDCAAKCPTKCIVNG